LRELSVQHALKTARKLVKGNGAIEVSVEKSEGFIEVKARDIEQPLFGQF